MRPKPQHVVLIHRPIILQRRSVWRTADQFLRRKVRPQHAIIARSALRRIGFGDFAQQMMDFLRRTFATLGWESELRHFGTRTNSDKVGASVLMTSLVQNYFGHDFLRRKAYTTRSFLLVLI